MNVVQGALVRGSTAVALALLIAVPPAQARPRLGPAGLLLAPLAIIGGIAGAAAGSRKAKAHRSHKARPSARRDRGTGRRAPEPAPRSEQVATKETSSPETGQSTQGGWAGPLFWPHAYDGVFEYTFAIPGDDGDFWARGFGDIIDGMFMPKAESRAGRTVGASYRPGRSWDGLCGSATPQPADAIVVRLRELAQPTPVQNDMLTELRGALLRATERIASACPDSQAGTPPERLRMMAARLAAMRQGVLAVQGPLRDFYNSLDASQRAAVDRMEPAGGAGGADARPASCASPVANWPQEHIECALQPTKVQRAQLEELRQRALGFAQFVASTCPREMPRTLVSRLEAVKDRLAVLRYAANNVSPAFEQFYRSLSESQKARFQSLARERRADRGP